MVGPSVSHVLHPAGMPIVSDDRVTDGIARRRATFDDGDEGGASLRRETTVLPRAGRRSDEGTPAGAVTALVAVRHDLPQP